MQMKFQISGMTGFVGTNLNKYIVDQGGSNVTALNLRAINWNIESDTDIVIHLAGKAHDLKKALSPDEYYKINYELTQQVYDRFLESNATTFIFISSVKAAADKVEDILFESSEPRPQTDYGKSKLQAEQYIMAQALPGNKRFYILRPCMIHGPGNKGNLNLLNQLVGKGIPYPLASFTNKRSYLSVSNLCFIIYSLSKAINVDTGVYNVSDDESLSTSEVVKILSKAANRKPRLWKVNPHIIRFLAKLGDIAKLPFSTEKLDKLTESYVVSNNKIKVALKITMPMTARNGLALTAKSFNNI
jgi:nucleoside-diphosphate-sugar epimerase